MSLRQDERRSKVGIDCYPGPRASLTFTLADESGHTASVAAKGVDQQRALAGQRGCILARPVVGADDRIRLHEDDRPGDSNGDQALLRGGAAPK